MASRAARMKSGGKHDDVAQDKALISKMMKAEDKKESGPKPKGYAAGGAAKARLGMASPSGSQAKVTSPVKSQRAAPKRPKMAI